MVWPALVPAHAAPDGSRRVGVDARAEASADHTARHEMVRAMLDAFADRTGLEHFRSTGVWTVGLDPDELAERRRLGIRRARAGRAEFVALCAWILDRGEQP